MDFDLSTFYPVLMFAIIAMGTAGAILVLTHLIGPKKVTPVKEMPYESGMDPIGSGWQKADVKFYLIAILFLVFDVELLFLYPWAVSAYQGTDGWSLIPEAFREPIFW